MNFYPEDYIVEVVVPFTDLNGVAIVPSALRAVLYDGEDNVLQDFGSISLVGASGQKTVSIPALLNSLSGANLREPRVLRVEMDTASGTIRKSHAYVIEAEQTIEIMTNSFLTYESAEVIAMDYVNMTGWGTATETRRRAALVEAYRRITSVPMKWAPLDVNGNPLVEMESYISRQNWLAMTRIVFDALPEHFRRALRTAQVIEADSLLSGDTVGRKHRAGIITETIGESSVTLRTGQIDYGLSQGALTTLAGYIHYNVRIARA